MSATPAERPDRRRILLWIGVAGACLAALGGMFGFHGGSVWRLPLALQGRVEAALSANGLAGLEVDMQGQSAALRGVVANASARTAAQHAALTAAGSGGPWAGGVTGVDTSGILVGAIERPFMWSVRREAAQVTLSGYVPSEQTKRALRSVAGAAFPNATITDDTHVAGGAPTAHWRDAAEDAIRSLAPMQGGEARFADEEIVFAVSASQAAIGSLRQRYQTPPAPFRVQIETLP